MQESIQTMIKNIIDIISENTPAIYMFGSIVLNDFKLGWSDIDIICLLDDPLTPAQADKLVGLRQELLVKEPQNKYYRLFEGGIISWKAFFEKVPDNVVYWGTSGQRLTDSFELCPFSRIELLKYGKVLYGNDYREHIAMPPNEEIRQAVIGHYNTIRKYANNLSKSLYSAGWLLDIARCLYTLETNDIIAKTKAGEWALERNLSPNKEVLERAVKIRKNPLLYKDDADTKAWLASLDVEVQKFADVLQEKLDVG